MNDVGQEVVVLEAVVDVDFFIVHRQSSGLDASLLEKSVNLIA